MLAQYNEHGAGVCCATKALAPTHKVWMKDRLYTELGSEPVNKLPCNKGLQA